MNQIISLHLNIVLEENGVGFLRKLNIKWQDICRLGLDLVHDDLCHQLSNEALSDKFTENQIITFCSGYVHSYTAFTLKVKRS